MPSLRYESGSAWDGYLQLVYLFFSLTFQRLVQLYAFFASMIPPLRFSDFLWVPLLVTFFGKHLNVRRIFVSTWAFLIYTSGKVSIGRWDGRGKTVL